MPNGNLWLRRSEVGFVTLLLADIGIVALPIARSGSGIGSSTKVLQYGDYMHIGDSDFEFERRFLVTDAPQELLINDVPDIIVQTYFLASGGYGLRVRLQATQPDVVLPLSLEGKAAVETFAPYFDLCMLTVKGPNIGGTRYEAERPIDINVGVELSLRGGLTLAKRRHGLWLGVDGWVIDVFSGENRPLIVAECERTSPVVDLEIPSFVTTEITGDPRFSNDELVNNPYSNWAAEYLAGLPSSGPHFETGFGQNRPG